MSCLRVWLGGLPVGLVDSTGLLVELGVELNMGQLDGWLSAQHGSTWGQICSTWGENFEMQTQQGVKNLLGDSRS